MSGFRQESWSLITIHTFDLAILLCLNHVKKIQYHTIGKGRSIEKYLISLFRWLWIFFFDIVSKLEKWKIVKSWL